MGIVKKPLDPDDSSQSSHSSRHELSRQRAESPIRNDFCRSRIAPLSPVTEILSAYCQAWGLDFSCVAKYSRCCARSVDNDLFPFLIPKGMPMVVSHVSGTGDIWCTPFFSVLPRAVYNANLVPSGLDYLRQLTLDAVLLNPVFRHELYFNQNVRLEPPNTTLVALSPQHSVWNLLEWEVEGLISPDVINGIVIRFPTPVLPLVFDKLQAMLYSILPVMLHPYVEYIFDKDRYFVDKEFLIDLLKFIVQVLDAVVVPVRKDWVQKIRHNFDLQNLEAKNIVTGVRIAFCLLNITKLDDINCQIFRQVDSLAAGTPVIEREFLKNTVPAEVVVKWIESQATAESILGLSELPSSSTPYFSRVITGIVEQLRYSSPEIGDCHVLSLNSSRMRYLKESFAETVTAMVKAKFDKVEGVTNSMITVTSPIYLLIENRTLKQLLNSLYFSLLPRSTRQTGRTAVPSSTSTGQNVHQVDHSLTEIFHQLQLVVRLHWSSAHTIYEELNLY